MNLSTLTLDQLSPRCLNLLGSILGGGEMRVILSDRAMHPATVLLESRTVVLDAEQAGLYDLALCARLLHHRELRKLGPADPDRRDRWLTLKAQRQLVPQARRQLKRDFPGILRLPGRYRPGMDLKGLHVRVQTVDWKPLPPLQTLPLGDPAAVRLEMPDTPEVELTATKEDFGWLQNALDSGAIPLQTLRGLEELPFLRVPFRLCLGEECPSMELIEEYLADPVNKDMIQGFMDCYIRKSEVRQERLNLGQRRRSGTRLDTNRLVEAVVAQRVGIEPRLFRSKASIVEPVFDPREHLVVLAFDINDLQRHEDWLEEDNRAATHRFLACLLTTYQRLEVDCVVLGFADQMLTLADGRHVCLHLSMVLKRLEDAFDEAFWNRLMHLVNHPPQLPGQPTCFHPLILHDITNTFDMVEREADHSYRTILWWARRGMHRDFPKYRTADFLRRTAERIDGEMADLERRFAGTLDTLASFLPADLKVWGRPGGYLRSIEMN